MNDPGDARKMMYLPFWLIFAFVVRQSPLFADAHIFESVTALAWAIANAV